MRRRLYGPDHEAYRETVREFLTREVVPYQHDWDRQHMIDRTVFARAAKAGIYGLQIDERFGGAGEHDYRYRMVVCEELARVFAFSFGLTVSLQDDLVLHYLRDLTAELQKQRWLPGFASGELIGALAMTEPGAGSDLKGIRTSARRDGDQWILNGQKTFISSGIMADVVVVAARTDPEGALELSACLSSSVTPLASNAAASSTRSGCPRKTPPSYFSMTLSCRRRTCWARRAAACPT